MADTSHSAATTQKPKLTTKILEQEGIKFFEKVDTGELPEWLRPIAQHLLHCRSRFEPEHEHNLFSKELEEFNAGGHDNETAREEHWVLFPPELHRGSVYVQDRRSRPVKQNKKASRELATCEDIRHRAVEWRTKQRDKPEYDWVDFLKAQVFRAFDDVQPRASEYHELFTRWEIYRDVLWNEFDQRGASASPNPPRTAPQPDLTFAFRIVDTRLMSTMERCLDVQVRGFSLDVLGELRNDEQVQLLSAPTTPLRRYAVNRRNSFGATNMMCFPWAVVEMKKSKPGPANETKCYCQAANASAQALVMREELVKKAKEKTTPLEACVIFAYTCIGPSIKLWMTYRDIDSSSIMMRCIWSSSLELTWGVLQLRMIVENMREWVYSRVKGDIARWVLKIHASLNSLSIHSQHRRRHSSGTPTSTSTATPARIPLLRFPKTAPARVGRSSYAFSTTPSRPRRNAYSIDDFIDDHGVSDYDWDGDYEPSDSSEESSSESDGDNDDGDSENDSDIDDDEDDEVGDLIRDMNRIYPDLKRKPDMKACFREYVTSDCSSEEEHTDEHRSLHEQSTESDDEQQTDDGHDTSDEQHTDDEDHTENERHSSNEEHTDDEDHTEDEGHSDDNDRQYYIDGKRMSNIFSRARQSLGMGALQVVECSKARRVSSRF